MARLLAKIHRTFHRLPLAWLIVMLAGCMSISPRPYIASRQEGEIVLPPPPATDSPTVTQAPPRAQQPPAMQKPLARQDPLARQNQQQSLRPVNPAPPATAAQPEQRPFKRPPEESLALPKSNAPHDMRFDPDEPPAPVTRDNRFPKVEPLPKIIPDEVTVPQLVELSVNSPTRRPLGAAATFQLTIRNAGDRPQEELIVRCRFDDGLVFSGSDKREVVRRLDRLGPGESREMALTLSSSIVGSHCCWFTVAHLESHDEVEITSKQVCVDYVVRQVDIEIVGPSQRTEGSRAEFNVSLSNTSSKSIVDAQVVVTFDKALFPRELSTGAEQKAGTLIWRLGALEPSEKVQLQMEFECRTQAHRACISVEVKGKNLAGDVDDACLEIIPVPGTLDLRISDGNDPLEVGQTGTYQVTVENIGLQGARRVALEAVASDNLRVVSAIVRTAGNEVPLKHKLDGNKVVFDVMEQLDPGTHLVYTIEVEGLRAGPAELRASLTSALSSTPVTTAEPTTVVEP